MGMEAGRRMPVGAEVLRGGGVHFRVWAPRRRRVEVMLEEGPGAGKAVALQAERDGYFSGPVEDAAAGTRYRYRLEGDGPFPDPASRWQPRGPHGPSEVVDPDAFEWTDAGWPGARLPGQVLYEVHVGTFTPEGDWTAATRELRWLASIGVTLVEVMPVAEFPGDFGWGYDGVDLFAPTRLYGTPDDFRRFVDRAHDEGIGVVLDVVYNHLGPDGNYLREFSDTYFSDHHETEWGEAINYDGPGSSPVRELFAANAAYWVREFHLDGLRLDATQAIFDDGPEHVLALVTRSAREAAGERPIVVIAENEPQHARLVRPPERGGYGIDALWNDDFHHSATVALTGRAEAYYTDYQGTPQELVSALRWGFLYQGQWYAWQNHRRGEPALDVPAPAFVTCIQNHDQVANSRGGERAHRLTTPGRLRAMTALLLLAPGTPMLFQGQEFAASAPFLYFADHEPHLAAGVRKGRMEFLSQFRSLGTPAAQRSLDDPAALTTFVRCKLDLRERQTNAWAVALHRDLLRLRRDDPAFRAQARDRMHGAVLAPEAFLLRFLANGGGDRLLLVNLGRDLRLSPLAEPLLAPPAGCRWRVLWSSEDVRYGGAGAPPVDANGEGWLVPGHAAVVLAPAAVEAEPGADG
jgi:maltooligosyltrehalose trehalohydrolase